MANKKTVKKTATEKKSYKEIDIEEIKKVAEKVSKENPIIVNDKVEEKIEKEIKNENNKVSFIVNDTWNGMIID